MTIDIVDLTDPAYSDLNAVQLAMVRAAQARKNSILAKAQSEVQELFYLMLANNNVRSTARAREEAAIMAQAEVDIEVVKDDLMYQLAYEALGTEGNEFGRYSYPENPNYNLTYSQRFLVVRNYYMKVTTNASARLAAYEMDTLARSYLGEFYDTLYDLLASYVK